METGETALTMIQSSPAPRRSITTMPPWPSWTIKEAAQNTGYHPEYLRRLINDGTINAVKVGTNWLIEVRSLTAYIAGLDPTDARTGARNKP